ncbi:MAG TPA: hypothetical protein VGP76_28355 [Planctomycetaceae bacterium]|nr:hypothetical protein [Planctomycetaceae bacterium]
MGPHVKPEGFKHWQQITGAPATEQIVAVHVPWAASLQSIAIKEPVNVPDPPYVVVGAHTYGHIPLQFELPDVHESLPVFVHAPFAICW